MIIAESQGLAPSHRRVPVIERPHVRVLIAVVVIGVVLFHIFQIGQSNDLGDFGSFYEAGRALGLGMNPYGVYPLTGHAILPGYFQSRTPDLDPPVTLPLFALFSRFPPVLIARLWYACNAVLYGFVISLLARAYPRHQSTVSIGWAIGLPSFWEAMALGQIYVVIAFIIVLAWLGLRSGRRVVPGILIGLIVAIKPNFLVWPALLLLSGYGSVAIVALVTTLASNAVPLLLYGPTVYAEWLAAVRPASEGTSFPTNLSIEGLAAQFNVTALGFVLAIALLISLAGWAWLRRPHLLQTSAVALVAALLASPIAWLAYVLFLLPVFFHRRWDFLTTIAVILLLVPVNGALAIWPRTSTQIVTLGFPWSWSLVLLLIAQVSRVCPKNLRD